MEINKCCFSLRGYNKACWIIEETCNLNCQFCFHNQFPKKDFSKVENKYDFLDIISSLHRNNVKHVILSGGEPLLSPMLFDIISLLGENGFLISISTNAIMATPQFCKQLQKTTVERLTVNLATICDDSGRIVENGHSSRVIEGIKNLVSYGFTVTLNNILHKSTTKEILIQNINYCREWGVKNISFTVPVCKSFCEHYAVDYFMDNQTIQRIRVLLEEIEHEIKAAVNITLDYPDCNSEACPANKEIFGAGIDGKLSTCLVKQYKQM